MEVPQLRPQYYNITYLCYLLCNSHQNISKNTKDGNASNYTTSSLKAGTRCNINVTAVFHDGNSNTVTASTNTTSAGKATHVHCMGGISYCIHNSAAPAGAPVGLTNTTVNKTSITVVWDTVPCSQQNGPITGYKLFYNDTNSNNVSVNISRNNHRLYNIQELTPSTRYTIAVAAVNDGGTGPYSDPPLTVWTLSSSDTGERIEMSVKCIYHYNTALPLHTSFLMYTDVTGHGDIGAEIGPVIAILFIIVMVTGIIIAVVVAVTMIKRLVNLHTDCSLTFVKV